MTSSEYKNTIEWTLSVQTQENEDTLTTAKRILTNLGVPFPHGTLDEAVQILSTRNYMGWNPCNAAQAKYCANHGYAAIGVTNNRVVIILPEDEAVTVDNTLPKVSHAAVSKLSELREEETTEMQYFVYAILLEDLEPMQGEHDVKVMAAATTTCSSCQGCNACQYVCERSCQTCNASCQSCNTCQGCNTCQDNCQVSCQTCNVGCQSCNTCNSCQTGCQTNNHTWSEWTVVKAATCKSTGIMRRVCKSCSATEQQTIPINPNAHSWADTITYSATHPHNGSRKCKLCGKEHPNAPFAYSGKYPGCTACNTLAAPTGLKAEVIANNTVKVTWNAVSGATRYHLLKNNKVEYDGNKNSYTFTGLTTGETYTFIVRAFDGVSTPSISEPCTVTVGLVEPLLIYRSRNREVYGFLEPSSQSDVNPIIAEDLEYGMKNEEVLFTNNTLISASDLYTNIFSKTQISIENRRTTVINFFNSQIDYDSTFSAILADMIDHFIGIKSNNFTGEIDSYNVYENSDLINAVVSHPNTTEYVNEFVSRLSTFINNNSGVIDNLIYDENLWIYPNQRDAHPVVNFMKNGSYFLGQPSYGFDNGVPGLALAIDALEGNKIEIINFNKSGSSYSGILRFSLYDHFGLDTSDLTDSKKYFNDKLDTGMKPGMFAGFRQWYIMQHWDQLLCTVHPKPFVTMITFTVPFNGTLQ